MKHRTGYLFKRGNNWCIQWRVSGKLFLKTLRDDNGQPITTKRGAEEARDKFMAPLAVGDEAAVLDAISHKLKGRRAELAKWDEEKNPPLPISQTWSTFLASPNRPDSGEETLYQYECQWSRFADWMKTAHPDLLTLRDVTKLIAEGYASNLSHGKFSPNTYNKHLSLLTLVFRVVRDKAKLTINPWEDIQRKRLVTHSRRELTVEELRNICQSATGEMRALLAVGVYSGLRLGDCATLRWAEVDLPRGVIRRVPNKIARSNPKPVFVPIHAALKSILSEIPAKDRGEYILPETAELYSRRIDAITDKVQAHFKACGIKVWKPGTGPDAKAAKDNEQKEHKRAVIEVGFHSLRHSFVSLCRASNAPLAVVESIVGHSNPAMTRHYTHVGEVAASSAVAALPAVIGEADLASQKREPAVLLREALVIAKSIQAKNWGIKRAELLALLAEQTP